MRVKRPPRGVASFIGLVLSSTLCFMLNRSTAFSARRGRVLQPVAFSDVREQATNVANINSEKKITNQARRGWAAVLGMETPKKAVDVAAEARLLGVVADVDIASRAGQAAKGEVSAPLPCANALGAPLAEAPPLKLYKGREVKPGQKEVLSQGVQAGTVPIVPPAQPKQERLCVSATLSEPKLAKAEGRKGGGQVREAQSAREAATARRGCLPAGQVKGRARHCVSCVAPVEAVVFPLGHAVHCDSATAPVMPL